MASTIELSRRDRRDIEEAFGHIRADAPENAVKWRRGLERKLNLVAEMPEAFGFAPEHQHANAEIRQALFGRYRILYTMRGATVFILTVRHGARMFLSGQEVDSIE